MTSNVDRDGRTQAADAERKYLEDLLKERFNFYLVFASLLLVAVFSSDQVMTDIQRIVVLAGGTAVSLLVFFSVYRTHRLAERALRMLHGTDHPWEKVRRLKISPPFRQHANWYLVMAVGLMTFIFLVLAVDAVIRSV